MRKRLSRTNRITVASTRVVEKDGNAGQSIEKRLNSDSSVGWYAPVAPNVLRPAYLISDVLINSHLILSAEGTMSLRVWSGPTTNSTLLLTTGQTITNGLPHTFATKGDTTEVWVEFLGAGSGTISYGFAGTGNAADLSFTDTVNVTVSDVRLFTDTDNNGNIDEAIGGEREFAQYAPGRLILMKGEEDGTMTPGPRAETRFKLMPDALAQSGTVTLSAVEGGNRVEVWNAEQGGAKITLPITYDPPTSAPQTLWVSGVSTGTAVLAASYTFINNVTSSNLTAYTVIPPLSVAPAVSNAYVWCSLPSLGYADGTAFAEELKNQGFNVRWFKDDDGTNTVNFFTCTFSNYLEMANAGAITIISHGDKSEHLAVYAPLTPAGEAACIAWCAGQTGMTVDFVDDPDPDGDSFWFVSVDTAWLETNWRPSLSNNNAITLWSICYSADTSAGTSVKEAAGGRWRSGYELPVDMYEATTVNNAFLGRMNGTISNGILRTAGSAYNDTGVDYHTYIGPAWNDVRLDFDWVTKTDGSVRMDGNPWTTLCPAPLAIAPVYPTSPVTENRKGWGCILLDTLLDNTPLATDAVIKEFGGAVISDTHWLKDTEGNFYGVGFVFDKTLDNSSTTMKAVSDKIRNKGTEGRAMDGNRVQPNKDDKQWSF